MFRSLYLTFIMKLVIGGSTGFVGTELVRQALAHPAITSIVGLSRRETVLPTEVSDASGKLISVVCDDFLTYSHTVQKALECADACIWYSFALTPYRMWRRARLTQTQDNCCYRKQGEDHAVGRDCNGLPRLRSHGYPDAGGCAAHK